jgi:hypothetical protein
MSWRPQRSRNPFPHLVNPLAAEWTNIAMLTVDACGDDPTAVDPRVMQWGRRAFYLSAQAALYVLAQGARR